MYIPSGHRHHQSWRREQTSLGLRSEDWTYGLFQFWVSRYKRSLNAFRYFLWDLSCCLYSWRLYHKSFLVHSIAGIATCSFMLRPLGQQHIVRFLLFEYTGAWNSFQWMLARTGFKKGSLMFVVRTIGIILYFVVRVVGGP